MIEVECIEASVPKLIQDYLKESAVLKEFYTFSPSLEGLRSAAAERVKFPVDRQTLVDVLKSQFEASSHTSKSAKANIDRLLEVDVYTITTGHQLCVLGGPLFFFYKILSAVKWSQLAEEQGIKSVPVYWMASEDHDFEEIRSTQIGGKTYDWGEDLIGPVGRHSLAGFQQALQQLSSEFDGLPGWKETGAFIASLFAAEKTLAQATRDLVQWAFGDMGVVVIDADDPKLKSLFTAQMLKDIFEATAQKGVEEASHALAKHDYGTQVTPRAINLFYMLDGYRERLEWQEGKVVTVDGKYEWTPEALKAHVNEHPERFSPNVVLRPMYQEVILPNLCYIGGPGELSYWLQFKQAFASMDVFFPQLMLRDMAVLMDAKTAKRMEQLGLSPTDVYRSEEELLKEQLRANGTHEFLVEERRKRIDVHMQELEEALEQFDPTLAESTRAEHQRILNRLEALKKKVLRADKRKNETLERRLSEWKDVVHPGGVPQERVLNWLSFFTDRSLSDGLEEMRKQFNPMEGYVRVITIK